MSRNLDQFKRQSVREDCTRHECLISARSSLAFLMYVQCIILYNRSQGVGICMVSIDD